MNFVLYCTSRFEAYLNQAMTQYTVDHNYEGDSNEILKYFYLIIY